MDVLFLSANRQSYEFATEELTVRNKVLTKRKAFLLSHLFCAEVLTDSD